MNRTEFIAKLESIYVGDKIAIEDVTNAYDKLQEQLKEKHKVIDNNFMKVKHIYNMLNHYKENHIICFNEDLWNLYQRMDKELLEILEKGSEIIDNNKNIR